MSGSVLIGYYVWCGLFGFLIGTTGIPIGLALVLSALNSTVSYLIFNAVAGGQVNRLWLQTVLTLGLLLLAGCGENERFVEKACYDLNGVRVACK